MPFSPNRQKARALCSANASAGLGPASGTGAADISFDLKPLSKGPDEEKIKAILDRTGYKLDVTTGQRKYGGPPPNWTDPPPPNGCEVSCNINFMLFISSSKTLKLLDFLWQNPSRRLRGRVNTTV